MLFQLTYFYFATAVSSSGSGDGEDPPTGVTSVAQDGVPSFPGLVDVGENPENDELGDTGRGLVTRPNVNPFKTSIPLPTQPASQRPGKEPQQLLSSSSSGTGEGPGDFSSDGATTAGKDDKQVEVISRLPGRDKTQLKLPDDYFGGTGLDENQEQNVVSRPILGPTTPSPITQHNDEIIEEEAWRDGPISKSTESPSDFLNSSPAAAGGLRNKKPITKSGVKASANGAVTRFVDNSAHHKPLDEVNVLFDDVLPTEVDVYHKGKFYGVFDSRE
jgi:hypothetical protein